MFVDYVKIYAKGGNGGNGAISFWREKYVENGGPDGGDGGRGGSIYLVPSDDINTLVDFRFKKKFIAEDGQKGDKANRTGKSADDVYIKVPKGTIVKDVKKDRIIADLSDDKTEFLLVKGGRGGKGNQHFSNSIRQAPKFAEIGVDGEEKEVILELKLISEVGLVGFPNVGKSTIISACSSARPKIANYHFTTLEPSLGVVKVKSGASFVLADIPGIIEGASEGVGLGIEFLRHIERTKLLLHVIDVAGTEGRDPVEDFNIINNELKKYSKKLANRKQIVVANKCDVLDENSDNLQRLEKLCKKNNLELFKISAVTSSGLTELMEHTYEVLKEIPNEPLVEIEEIIDEFDIEDSIWEVKKVSEDTFEVTGKPIERLMKKVNIYDFESRKYMQRVLKSLGVTDELKKQGVKDGDTVIVNEYELEYEE